MRILTDVSKAELDYLTNQPTAKAMIDKVKTEGKYIPEGDVAGAAEFVASRKQERQEDALSISAYAVVTISQCERNWQVAIEEVLCACETVSTGTTTHIRVACVLVLEAYTSGNSVCAKIESEVILDVEHVVEHTVVVGEDLVTE